uniref:UBA domain-containing protein n=1 Tax=Heterosigma akashiwo TaxID=2829 RepID=A0A7S4D4Q1_HETAK
MEDLEEEEEERPITSEPPAGAPSATAKPRKGKKTKKGGKKASKKKSAKKHHGPTQYQEEAWAEQLSTLEAMGFPRETALKALYQVGGRLEPALGQLMGEDVGSQLDAEALAIEASTTTNNQEEAQKSRNESNKSKGKKGKGKGKDGKSTSDKARGSTPQSSSTEALARAFNGDTIEEEAAESAVQGTSTVKIKGLVQEDRGPLLTQRHLTNAFAALLDDDEGGAAEGARLRSPPGGGGEGPPLGEGRLRQLSAFGTLTAMGFPEEQVLKALAPRGCSVEEALENIALDESGAGDDNNARKDQGGENQHAVSFKQEEIEKILTFGFNEEEARDALVRYAGDFERAINYLLTSMEDDF